MMRNRRSNAFAMLRSFLICASATGGLVAGGLAASTPPVHAQSNPAQITIIYDAFGKASNLKQDWGFAALIEYDGKRILFDTGNNAEIFAHNVEAKGIDLRQQRGDLCA